jgi:hypothetical protein
MGREIESPALTLGEASTLAPQSWIMRQRLGFERRRTIEFLRSSAILGHARNLPIRFCRTMDRFIRVQKG